MTTMTPVSATATAPSPTPTTKAPSTLTTATVTTATLSTTTTTTPTAITQPLQIGPDRGFQPRRFRELLVGLVGEPLHLVLERLVVVLDLFRADVAARRQHITVLGNLRLRRRSAEAGNVLVTADLGLRVAGFQIAAPGVIRVGQSLDFLVGQFPMHAVNHRP